jgi:hypothetical protein
MNAIEELQQWYLSNCDGDWEHSWGVEIKTLDNPGWSLKINLYETNLKNRSFEQLEIDNGDGDWMNCRVEQNIFKGFGDPNKLIQLVETFLNWAKSQNSDWLVPPASEDFWLVEDRGFYNLLKNSPATLEPCHKEGCDKRHLYDSVMCAEHHFEMVKNYRYSGIDEEAVDRELENNWD